MPRLSPLWIALACATGIHSTATAAPDIWRCGNSYSDIPCEGGKRLGAAATPSAQDRRQRDEGTRRDQAAAERMRRERLELEARPRQAAVIAPPAPREASGATPPAASTLRPNKKKKNARPKKADAFVATYTDPAAPPAARKKK